jgi:hypothetical protein
MCGLGVLLIHLAGTQCAIASQYTIDILINPYHPEIFDSWLFGINNQGQTTGYTVTRNAANHFVQNVVTYRAGNTQTLFTGATGGLSTSGLAINEGGDVVGNASDQLTFFPAGGGATPIAVPGFDFFPAVHGLNSSGSVLVNDYPSEQYNNAERFAIWNSGVSSRITAIESLYPYTLPPDPNDFNSGPSTSSFSRQITGLNNAGQFAASVEAIASDPHDPNDPNDDTFTEQYAHAYVFNGHGGFNYLQPPTPVDEIDPIAIDAAGSILGWAGDHLAIWGLDGAVKSVLPDPGTTLKHIGGFGYSSVAWNGLGQIVGVTTASGIEFYDPVTNAWTDITGSINGLGIGTFSSIQGFNDQGQFVGLVRPPVGGGVFGYVVSPVPEPSSPAIGMCGLIFTAAAGHRKGRTRRCCVVTHVTFDSDKSEKGRSDGKTT